MTKISKLPSVKEIKVILEDGTDLIFHPSFPTTIQVVRGVRDKYNPQPWLPVEMEYNGKEALIILSMPDDIRQEIGEKLSKEIKDKIDN